ncbi:acyl carrier protein [Streptomyces sp. bgisy022]|uniref:acyl carrier protein n=1 Tax=Streptomyces sp. bgisy022 TaxID=3413769 RepID=UPI003D7439C7
MPDTYATLRSVLTSAFRVPEEEIRPELTLAQLDLDSLALTELVLILHERLGVKIDAEHASRGTTLARIVEHLDALRAGTTVGTGDAGAAVGPHGTGGAGPADRASATGGAVTAAHS